MNYEEAVCNLEMCRALMLFDAVTGKTDSYENLNQDNKNLYDACAVAMDALRRTAEDDKARTRIAELEAKLEAIRMDYNALQESYINSEMNLENLQSHDKEAMELLEAAIGDMRKNSHDLSVCPVCADFKRCNPYKTGCVGCVNMWRWQHADRYEALKAQLNN